MSEGPKWGVPEALWTGEDHLAFRVYVAREHVRGRMPIVELHRSHDIPLPRRSRRPLTVSRARPVVGAGDALLVLIVIEAPWW